MLYQEECAQTSDKISACVDLLQSIQRDVEASVVERSIVAEADAILSKNGEEAEEGATKGSTQGSTVQRGTNVKGNRQKRAPESSEVESMRGSTSSKDEGTTGVQATPCSEAVRHAIRDSIVKRIKISYSTPTSEVNKENPGRIAIPNRRGAAPGATLKVKRNFFVFLSFFYGFFIVKEKEVQKFCTGH
eukprot:Nk52_evm7s375 gene=Nk52_evmTU7s375